MTPLGVMAKAGGGTLEQFDTVFGAWRVVGIRYTPPGRRPGLARALSEVHASCPRMYGADCLGFTMWEFGPLGKYAYNLDNIDTARELQTTMQHRGQNRLKRRQCMRMWLAWLSCGTCCAQSKHTATHASKVHECKVLSTVVEQRAGYLLKNNDVLHKLLTDKWEAYGRAQYHNE